MKRDCERAHSHLSRAEGEHSKTEEPSILRGTRLSGTRRTVASTYGRHEARRPSTGAVITSARLGGLDQVAVGQVDGLRPWGTVMPPMGKLGLCSLITRHARQRAMLVNTRRRETLASTVFLLRLPLLARHTCDWIEVLFSELGIQVVQL